MAAPEPVKISLGSAETAYHVDSGAFLFPYAVDARSAVSRHPAEWSMKPWSAADTTAARQARIDAHKKAEADAEANGLPKPQPLVLAPVIEPTMAEAAEIDADAKARVDAAALIAAADEEARKQNEKDEKLAQARVLLQSAPPRPDPNVRRPFGRSGPMTPAERTAAAKRAAAKAEADAKTNADEKAKATKAADDAKTEAANQASASQNQQTGLQNR